MHGAVSLALLVLATSARAQTDAVPPSPPQTEPRAPAEVSPPPPQPAPAEVSSPAAAQPAPAAAAAPVPGPGEVVIPQYPPGMTPPSEGPVKLDPAAYSEWRKEKLSFAAGTSTVVQGPNGDPVDRVAFYKLVGRPDLAAKQQDGYNREIWFIAGGAVVTAAGLIGGIALANSNDAPITYGTTVVELCRPPVCTISTHTWQTTTGTIIAIAGALAGGVLISLGLVAASPVTSVEEDKTLLGEYNDLLLQRLSSKPKAAAPSPVPTVGFNIGSGGGMLQAGWRF